MSILNRGHARHGVIVPKIAPISGRYYGPRTSYGGTSSNSAQTADVLTATPFFVPASFTADLIGLGVVTGAAAGKLLRIGIYSATAAGLPDALLVDSGSLAADSTGIKSAAISFPLVAGTLYFAASNTDGAPTVNGIATIGGPFGDADPSSIASRHTLIRTLAYGALPATWGTPANYSAATPAILVRAT